MPPWKAEPGYGEFANERRLSDAEIALLGTWARNGAPEGDAHARPAPPKFPEGWQAGTPDKVLTLDGNYTIAGDGCGPTCQIEPTVTVGPSPTVAVPSCPSASR